MSLRTAVLLPAALFASLATQAGAHRMEHRISLKGRTLAEVASHAKHKRFFPKDAQEVVRNLQALAERMRRWYDALEPALKKSPKLSFPKASRWTPSKLACPVSAPPHPADHPEWLRPGWTTLGFRPTEPHRFQYRVVSVGAGREASFSIQARADRDCNGRKALYRLSGHARAGALLFQLLRVRHARE